MRKIPSKFSLINLKETFSICCGMRCPTPFVWTHKLSPNHPNRLWSTLWKTLPPLLRWFWQRNALLLKSLRRSQQDKKRLSLTAEICTCRDNPYYYNILENNTSAITLILVATNFFERRDVVDMLAGQFSWDQVKYFGVVRGKKVHGTHAPSSEWYL